MLETIILGAVLLAMYLFNGTAVIPAMTGAAAAGAFGAAALFFLARRNFGRAKELGLKAAVLLGAAALIYGAMTLNAGKAARGAERIAAACEAYKAKTGAYPAELKDLVPDYLAAIPRAKFTVMWGGYRLGEGKVLYALDPWIMMASSVDIATKKHGFESIDGIIGYGHRDGDRRFEKAGGKVVE